MSMYVLLCPCCICCGIVDKEGAIKGNLQVIIRKWGVDWISQGDAYFCFYFWEMLLFICCGIVDWEGAIYNYERA